MTCRKQRGSAHRTTSGVTIRRDAVAVTRGHTTAFYIGLVWIRRERGRLKMSIDHILLTPCVFRWFAMCSWSDVEGENTCPWEMATEGVP